MKGKIIARKLVLAVCLLVFPLSDVMAQDFCESDLNYDGSVAADDVTFF